MQLQVCFPPLQSLDNLNAYHSGLIWISLLVDMLEPYKAELDNRICV